MSLNILQLSDIHLCNEKVPFASSILLSNEFYRGAPDIILVTGDIFNYSAFNNECSEINNIKKAVDFFDDLIKDINNIYDSRLNKESFLFIPGNHEINRNGNNLDQRLKNYKLFLDTYYNGSIPNCYNDDLTFIKIFDDKKVILVGFRSPNCDFIRNNNEPYDDYGLIDDRQLFNIKQKLKKIVNKCDYSIIAALHHQFILMEERDKSYVEKNYLRNSEQFVSFLSDNNFCAVLHGHKHINSNKRLNIETDITKPEKIITVLGCGSISEQDNRNWYNYISIFPPGYKYEIEYSTYYRENSGYTLEKEAVKLPVVKNNRDVLSIQSLINNDPDLTKAYNELCSYDIITDTSLIYKILDKTIFSLGDINEQIKNLPDILYFILSSAHYRTVLRNDSSNYVLKKIDSFIDKKKNEYFINSPSYDQILKLPDICEFYKTYINSVEFLNKNQKKIILYSLITSLMTEFYLIIKYGSQEFYNNIVSKKIDFAYTSRNLLSEIHGNSIEFSIDDDRRSLEISVLCDTAGAIKICSLIIKEFEIILNDFEKDFADCGFRVYYIHPRLKHEGVRKSDIDSKQFTSYIPKLLPLLAGNNIYSSPEAFAREVIQNSIDAINVRREYDSTFKEEGQIIITIKYDRNTNLNYFNIQDNGSGMTQYILERYLTTLGLSFYGGVDYKSLNPKYNPISQFGIGFLSCFMVGKHIEIWTRHMTDSTGWFLDIPNYDGCFFIENDKSINITGTSIRIWENPDQGHPINSNKIIRYIQSMVRNVNVNVFIYSNVELEILKGSYWNNIIEKTQIFSQRYFIPIIKKSNEWVAIPENNYEKFDYGIILYKPDNELYKSDNKIEVLNNGILVPSLGENESLISKLCLKYFNVSANLPPNVMTLDVSRDNIKKFNDNIDWESIYTNEVEIINENVNKKLPYYILQQIYDINKYPNNQVCFEFKQKTGEIIVQLHNNHKGGNAENIRVFLNYISGDLYKNKIINAPISPEESNKRFNESVTSVLFDLFGLINTISGEKTSKPYNKRNKYSNLDVSMYDTFLGKNIDICNEIERIVSKYKGNSAMYNNEIIYIANAFKEHFKKVRTNAKNSITNMFLDKRYTAPSITIRNNSEKLISIVLSNEQIQYQLKEFFTAVLNRIFSYIEWSKGLSLAKVAMITCSAIYALLDYASIICSYEMLENGVHIIINRNEIEPDEGWFSGFSQT